MESSADEIGALCETVVFLGYFRDLPDARQSGKVKYPLDEILLLWLLAVVAGAEAITDIAKFGRLKLALLRRFRPFEDGTPAHDHLGDILATLDAEAFERCFVAWVAAQTGVPAEVVAIDGKTARRAQMHRRRAASTANIEHLGGVLRARLAQIHAGGVEVRRLCVESPMVVGVQPMARSENLRCIEVQLLLE